MKQSFSKLHKVQRRIIKKISGSKSARFNELKIEDMDPKRFTYHLKKLVKYGLVKKEMNGDYKLTDSGKTFISHFEEEDSLLELNVDAYVLLYVKKDSKLLVVKREIQPYFGFTGVPCVNTRRDKTIKQMAQAKLDNLNLTGDLALSLIVEVMYLKNSKPRNHACMFIFYSENVEGAVVNDEEGEYMWVGPKEILQVEKYYDNSKDLIEHFEREDFDKEELKFISREYNTPW